MAREDGAAPERDEGAYVRTEDTLDFGRDGTALVTVLDPCRTREARERRRAALTEKCRELLRRERA